MPPIWVETPDGRGKEHDMTMQMTGQTVRLPQFRHCGWVLAAIGAASRRRDDRAGHPTGE